MSEKTAKPYNGAVYDSNGLTIEDEGYLTPQAAKRAVCRELFKAEPGSKGVVIFNKMILPKSGIPLKEAITRDFAIAEIMKGRRSPVTQRKAVGSTANHCRAKESRCSFSGG